MEKLVSIIIPCYNVESYVSRCLDSLVVQTIGLENLEIICIDDSSTDATWSILKEYEIKYRNVIRLFQTPRNIRQGGARNIGIRNATAPYIGFVDADDWIEPVMFEHMYQKIVSCDVDLVQCKNTRDAVFLLHNEDIRTSNIDQVLYIATEHDRAEALASSLIGFGVWDKLFRRDFLIEHEMYFPEELVYEDIYWGSLVYLYMKGVYILEEKLYHYFVNTTSTVLLMDDTYHLDMIMINRLKHATYQEYQCGTEMKAALEFDLLYTYYLACLKMLLLRFTEIPYDIVISFFKECRLIFPNILNNPYIQKMSTPMQKYVIALLECEMQKEEIESLAQIVRKNGI